MNLFRIIAGSLRHHWRIHAAVALGVVAATAVLTGALAVGDSVRYSLRRLTLDRLGRIDEVLLVDRFVRQVLASELAAQPKFKELYASATPAILFPAATAESSGERRRIAANVQVLGSEPAFWDLSIGAARPKQSPGDGEVVLNAPLAEELNVKVGDTLTLRFGTADQVPADSPLGRRSGQVASLAELKVTEIIPAEGLGRFSLQPSQIAPRAAFVSLAAMQAALEVESKANAIVVGGRNPDEPAPPQASAELAKLLTPRLTDYGLALKHIEMKFGKDDAARTIYDYYSLTSDRMLLDDATELATLRAFADLNAQPVLTYLANEMQKIEPGAAAGKGIPYSTITAIDPAHGGPLVDGDGQPLRRLADDEIVLTSWAASDLKAQVGDTIRVTYFEPETTHGNEREKTTDFRIAAIVPLTEPVTGFTRRDPAIYEQPPTPTNDPDLTPAVKGITDQESIANWDPPFPFDRSRIRDEDDAYYENHRTTPKAYVSLRAGQRLWGSRFGKVTSFRIPAAPGVTAESLEHKFLADVAARRERLGLDFLPLKRQGLAASAGTTPFDVLFLLLSMFIIASALMLVWLLFRLGVEQRAGEIGLLLALGWTRAHVRRLFVLEGSLIATIGAALGVLGGVGYAWLMIAGLKTWWVGAIASPLLLLHVSSNSVAIGFAIGLVVSVLTIWFSLGRVKKAVVRSLLAGEIVPMRSAEFGMRSGGPVSAFRIPHSAFRILPWAAFLFLAAVALAFYAATLGGEAQAGAFMGAGAALLTSLLLFTTSRLGAAGSRSTLLGGGALGRLAFRNAGRNVGRSTATIALMASASFLIVAVSAFRMSPTDRGIGGFDLLAESSQPIYEDINTEAGRRELLAGKSQQLAGSTILALRLKGGDDASCRNLYQPSQPRILGVTPALISYFDDPNLPARFGWSASAAKSPAEKANPWRLLANATPANQTVPVVLDQNTARYSLRLYGGVGATFPVTYADGTKVEFRVAGLLSNSVLQGSLLIGEADFQRLFPRISGYRYFLIRTPAGKTAEVAGVLEDQLSDQGLDAISSRERLADLLAVQNTYISTFQSLGALGLVLGTFGLAAVQLRSVFERRKELALMRATGFRRRRLGEMVLLENLVLLLGGLVLGTIAALVAVLPQMLFGGASVPLLDLLAMLAVVLVVGIATGLIAVRATLRAPLVGALRGE